MCASAQVNLAENDDDSTSTLTFAEFCECIGMMALTAFENIRRIQSRRYGKISPQVRAHAYACRVRCCERSSLCATRHA